MYHSNIKVNTYFKLRLSSKGREHRASVVCEIKINTQIATQFATGVKCYPALWDYENHRLHGNDQQTRNYNTKLDKIERDIDGIVEYRLSHGLPVNARDVHFQYTKPPVKIPTFLELLHEKRDHCISNGIGIGTTRNYGGFIKSMEKYLRHSNLMKIPITEFNAKTWDNYKAFTKNSKVSLHTKLTFFKSAFKYAVRCNYIDKHQMLHEENPKEKSRDLMYLNEEQISRLLNLEFNSATHNNYRKAFLFQCFTGLGFEELCQFDKTKHIENIRGKDYIIIKRKKTSKVCTIPILKQTKDILESLESKFKTNNIHHYNMFLKFIGEFINFENVDRLTSHVGRKTAGFYLLNNGVPIEVVSSILGHSNITITQQIYASILTGTIDTATLHLQ
jgi:integrase/recombinase XerD